MAPKRVPPLLPLPAQLTWLESPVQVSGMSHSFTASRQDTPRGSYCTRGDEATTSGAHGTGTPAARWI